MASRDTQLNQPPDPALTSCPFCAREFKSLGNHLPKCKERHDRDYSSYLSKKTLDRKAKTGSSRKSCPKCHKKFLRLDTHLKNNPFCKSIETSQISSQTSPCNIHDQLMASNNLDEPASCSLSEPTSATSDLPNTPTKNEFPTRLPLKLPSSQEGWLEADTFFADQLVPQCLSASSPDEKNRILIDGIYDYFAQKHGTKKQNQSKCQKRREKHNRALKTVKRLKNEARREFQKAKKDGVSPENIQQLARKFFDLVREHSRVKRSSITTQQRANSRKVRHHCHRHFWKFAKELLDDKSSSQVVPSFTEAQASSYFREIYHAGPRNFDRPDWLPAANPPEVELDCEEFVLEEVKIAIKRSKSSSTPSPIDQISYQVFKRCPSLSAALLNLFNLCWLQASVPSQWKVAAIKLIGKSSAAEDPTSPINFRPIALTPCIGKLFTTILRNRWLSYMTSNKYINRDVQKAFMKATPGCTEHHTKLAAILSEARQKHKSLTACWIDLTNAYGSVHHALIQYSLRHYHAPSQFQNILKSLYSDLSGKVITQDWVTPTIPLEIGVYQGDPLSVVIFNTVINTLVDTLQSRTDLGYNLSNSNHQVNLLQYADDTCILANSPASAQHLLNMTSDWLQWSGMKAKVTKCHSLAVAGSSGKLFDPKLQVSGDPIPYVGSDSIKFLGLKVQVPYNPSEAKQSLRSALLRMLQAVDACPLTRNQKLKMYKAGICPRLSWLLMIEEYPLTWVERELEADATKFLKKWAGLARSANTALLYLPCRMGGLNLPALSSLYKRLQVSRQCQLLTSPDPCVRHIAEKQLQAETCRTRKKFKPAVVVRDAMVEDPGASRKALLSAAKGRVNESDNVARLNQVKSLERQGEMLRATTPDTATIWAKAIQSLPQEQTKFALNAAVDTLPHNSNLHLWRKKESDSCPLCGERQSLIHVLNCCRVARDLRRYNVRHDAVLKVIADTVKEHLPPSHELTVDLNHYKFPIHISPTDLRPDIVLWSDSEKQLILAELTVSFETSFEAAAERKETNYQDLVSRAEQAGYSTTLITLEMGSRGVPHLPGFTRLAQELTISRNKLSNLLLQASQAAITGSFQVWCARNRTDAT